MVKYKILYEKLHILKMETELAILKTNNDDMQVYLNIYKENILRLMNLTNNKTINDSEGASLGVFRAISEFDELAAIDALFNAAYDVDDYYSNNCKSFEIDINKG